MKYTRRITGALVGLVAGLASGQTVLVDPAGGGDYLTIQAALDWADDGVTILIEPATYFECLSIVNRTGVLQCADPTMRFEIESADWSACSGGTAMVTIENSSIDMKWFNLIGDDTYTRTGILCIDSTLDLEMGIIYAGQPAGIDVEGGSDVQMSFIAIENAEAMSGINIDLNMTGSVTMNKCQFIGNSVWGGRGLSSLSAQATISITDSDFHGHQPQSGHGGAVKVSGGNLSLLRTSIQEASVPSPGHGAGLMFSALGAASLSLVDCNFIDNVVGGLGGGLYVNANADDTITISGCVFSGNESGLGATLTGGSAVYASVDGGVQVVLENCDFFDNAVVGLSDSSVVAQVGSGAVLLNDCLLCGNEVPLMEGTYTLTGTSSVVGSCSQGACCVGTSCGQSTQSGCLDMGGTWSGAGTDCANIVCLPDAEGACCLGGYCMVMGEMDCLGNEGVFLGSTTSCATANCAGLGVPPTGGCCNSGLCIETTESFCNDSGGSWAGMGIACADAGCAAACQSDVVRDRVVDIHDLMQLLADWGMCP